MKTFKKSIFAAFAVVAGISLTTACSDANEYEDAYTDNPSWIENYTDSTKIAHPESVRGTGIKQSAFGQEVQGFVESLDFVSADSVAVKMSQGTTTDGTWVDDSNTEKIPLYEYTYSATTGNIQILQRNVNKGQVTKTAIFVGVAVNGTWDVITLIHYGDTPVQTYLVKQ